MPFLLRAFDFKEYIRRYVSIHYIYMYFIYTIYMYIYNYTCIYLLVYICYYFVLVCIDRLYCISVNSEMLYKLRPQRSPSNKPTQRHEVTVTFTVLDDVIIRSVEVIHSPPFKQTLELAHVCTTGCKGTTIAICYIDTR